MARPVEHDIDEVLNSATMTFWEKGYAATSMSDLIKSTGLAPRSMYNIFKSKSGLFNACLKYYEQSLAGPYLSKLKESQGKIAVRNYLMEVCSVETPYGCFFVNTMSGPSGISKKNLSIATDFYDNIEKTVREKLNYASKNEGYQGSPQIAAKALKVFLLGLPIHARSGASVREKRKLADNFLDSIQV